MVNIIDRRPNPKGKSLPNRQKFIRRSKDYITDSIKKNIKDANIDSIDSSGNITIPAKGVKEYRFRHSSKGGSRDYVLPGNEHYDEGDTVPRPGGGGGGKGKKAGNSGEGEDEFSFVLTRDEFLDIFFEDLDLPNLVKKQLKEIKNIKYVRAGYTTVGSPTNINIIQSLRNSIGRRIALRRPKVADIDLLIKEKEELEELVKNNPGSEEVIEKLKIAIEKLEKMQSRLKFVSYIDPIDMRYNSFDPRPEPNTKAVMFCVMDVSGSMGEREKDLAKRFFVLLYLFLERRYDKIEIVFIRHTHEAKEVDEKEFFHSRESGGTVVSKGLEMMHDIIKERYPINEWNIYAAQASDGENYDHDSAVCYGLLMEKLMPVIQYYAYIEITNERQLLPPSKTSDDELWGWYQKVAETWKNFSTARIAKPQDIFPVFRKLFAKEEAARN